LDKYGLSWQVVTAVPSRMMTDPDAAKAGRAMQAMLRMKKLDIAELELSFGRIRSTVGGERGVRPGLGALLLTIYR